MPDQEQVRQVAERVVTKIRELTPKGLGAHGWEFSRPYVAPYEDPYLDALNAWAREDTPTTRQALQGSAERFVGAWKRAGEEWERSSHPKAPGREEATA